MLPFLKYYKHLFKFHFSIDSEEADAQNWLAAGDVEKFIGQEYTTKRGISMEPNQYIAGRWLWIIIPKGSTFIVRAHKEKDFLALLEVQNANETYVTVQWDELPVIANLAGKEEEPSLQDRVKGILSFPKN